MMTRKVRVVYKGEIHIVDVPCEPHHRQEDLEKRAIQSLKRAEERRRTKRNQLTLQRLGLHLI